jgi:hypothetical protein
MAPGSRHDPSAFGEMIGDLRGPGLMREMQPSFSEENSNTARCLKRKLLPILKPKDGLKDDLPIGYASFFKHAKTAYGCRGMAEGSL